MRANPLYIIRVGLFFFYILLLDSLYSDENEIHDGKRE